MDETSPALPDEQSRQTGEDHDCGQDGGSGVLADIQSVGHGDGSCSGMTDNMAAMFGRLREAAAAHDGA